MLIANLLAEAEWAETGDGDEARVRAAEPPGALSARPSGTPDPARVPVSQLAKGRSLAAASAVAGSLMRVLARDDRETLWLPALPKDLVVPDLSGLPLPRLRSDSDPVSGKGSRDDSRIIAWAETAWVAGLRAISQAGHPSLSLTSSGPDRRARVVVAADRMIAPADFRARLRDLEPPTAAAAARANHRAFSLALARRRGWSLPGEVMVEDREALSRQLRALPSRRGAAPAWVLKAAWSAAGRDRVFGEGADLEAPALRARILALFQRSPALRLEPWMAREADFGCVGLALPEGPRLLGMHRLHCDRRGAFRAIDRSPDPDLNRQALAIGLGADEQEAMLEAFSAAGRALSRIEYCGPYGIDAWQYREADGGPKAFQCLGEINARLTMGHLAHLLVDRLGSPGDAHDGLMRLELGRLSRESSPGTQVLASAGGFAAWLRPLSLPSPSGAAIIAPRRGARPSG